jgi:hypothetical protein
MIYSLLYICVPFSLAEILISQLAQDAELGSGILILDFFSIMNSS